VFLQAFWVFKKVIPTTLTLNKKLGKQLSPEGGDISGLYMDDGYLFFRAEAVETAVYNDTIDHEIRI
jgi:outer membrane protein insertion porin family